MDAIKLGRLRDDLTAFLEGMTADLGRADRRRWALAYVRGLLLDGDRKSAGAMAGRLAAIDHTGRDCEQGLQQLLADSPWADRPVRDRLARWAAGRAGRGERVVVVDDTGFPKKGRHSVGVAPQYSGSIGAVGNCQVAVTVQLAAAGAVVCLDAALYLPRAWADDPARCAAAGVPDGVGYRPKWQLALGLLDRARANGVAGVVLADADYGSVAQFRAGVATLGWTYAVAVRPGVVVIAADEDLGPVPPWRGTGTRPRRPARVRHLRVKATATRRWAADRAGDFRRVTWRAGTKGPLRSRFAAWRVRPAGKVSSRRMPGDECWLLAEWPAEEAAPAKFYLSNLPADTPLRALVRAAKGRWWVEQSYQQMKEELGLDHFEGRSWRGWHHHVTLVLLAYAFLASVRRAAGKKGAAGRRSPRSAG
jgi:SRSO17 transposase